MYAIVEIAGKQYKVEKDIIVNVDRLKNSPETIIIDKVLLYSNEGDIRIGQPYLDNVKVKAEVLGEIKGKKVRGIKFKKRKNYTRTLGHRPLYSQLKISELVANWLIKIEFLNLSFGIGVIFPDSGAIKIKVEGHSGYSTKGNDIVCAGISTLFQTFILSVSRILKLEQKVERNESGLLSTEIDIQNLDREDSDKLKLLIESFILGSSEISKEYPGTIIIDIERH